ncbi:MAG TPA: hypothetical protein DIT25_02040 [Candidatus Moranbacteria bacterium]|nr:hypothetical protein [Candidatus Moranbacteria bacterium]
MNETISGAILTIKDMLVAANIPMAISSMIEDFVKIKAEYKYNELEKTKYFRKLKSLEDKQKLVIIALMFLVNSQLKNILKENTPWMSFLKGILTDFFPEIGKRLWNGDSSPDPDEQEVIDMIRIDYAHEKPSYGPAGKSFFKRAKDDFEDGLDFILEKLEENENKGGHK